MSKKIAINGFGRIGRNAFKLAFERDDIEVVAINDLTDTKTLAHLLKHDSTYGTYHYDVSYDENSIFVAGKQIRVLAERDPALLPWGEFGIDVVIEATGLFVQPEKARAHINAGAKKVVISAPAKGEGAKFIVLGVNEHELTREDDIISNASCTTNCIAPVMAVLEREFGIEKALMTTVHSYTASQRILDAPAKDLREARSAAENIVPTTTGAAKAVSLVIPELEGRLTGKAYRVPTANVSVIDLNLIVKNPASYEDICAKVKEASENEFKGIIEFVDDEVVSCDFIGDPCTCIFDAREGIELNDRFFKFIMFYDNEYGYSVQLLRLIQHMGKVDNK